MTKKCDHKPCTHSECECHRRPLTTDYRYGGVGNIDREDLPVPNGWKKGK